MFLNLLIFIDFLFINSSLLETPFSNQIESWQTIKLDSIKNPTKKSTCVNEIIYEICDEKINSNGFLPSKCGKFNYYSHALSKIPFKILYKKTKTTLTENDCKTETTMIQNYFTDKTYENFSYKKNLISKKTTYSATLPYDFVAISNPFVYSNINDIDGINKLFIMPYQSDSRTFECMFYHFFGSSINPERYITYLKNWKSFGDSFININSDPLRSNLLSIIDLDTLNFIMNLIQGETIDLGYSMNSIYDAFSEIAERCLQNITSFAHPQFYLFQDITNLLSYDKSKTHRFQIFKFRVNVDESIINEQIFLYSENY